MVFERASQVGSVWRNDRWDSFTLLTPNWSIKLPGMSYSGNNPDGFLTRNELVAYFEKYIENFDLPVQYNTAVTEVTQLEDDRGYLVQTNDRTFQARNVVVATGQFQTPKIPEFSANLPGHVLQIHSGQYRHPEQLPEGAVLIVGSAQSGTQIAEELHQSGRAVYLCG